MGWLSGLVYLFFSLLSLPCLSCGRRRCWLVARNNIPPFSLLSLIHLFDVFVCLPLLSFLSLSEVISHPDSL